MRLKKKTQTQKNPQRTISKWFHLQCLSFYLLVLQFNVMRLLLLHFFLSCLWKADMFISDKIHIMVQRGRSQIVPLFHKAEFVAVQNSSAVVRMIWSRILSGEWRAADKTHCNERKLYLEGQKRALVVVACSADWKKGKVCASHQISSTSSNTLFFFPV